MDQSVSSGSGEKWKDSGYTFYSRATRIYPELDLGYERKKGLRDGYIKSEMTESPTGNFQKATEYKYLEFGRGLSVTEIHLEIIGTYLVFKAKTR